MTLAFQNSCGQRAFSTATYVHNRTPTQALGGRTPYEVLYGVKPDVSHLRTFGTPYAIVELNELLKKLDNRARMCFYVGYKYSGAVGVIIGCRTEATGESKT